MLKRSSLKVSILFIHYGKMRIPARKKILEIEEGIIPIKTEVLDNPEEIAKKLRQITLESSYLNIYSSTTEMALGRDQYESTNENIKITSINDRKDIEIIELFLKEGIQIKHNPNISSMNFVISDSYFASATEKVNGAQMISNFLVSNDPVYIEHFFTVFENAWKFSVGANERVAELQLSHFLNQK
jgi:hypothetical protein